MFQGQVVRSFAGPDSNMRGIYHDGRNLWVMGQGSQLIYLVDPLTGETLKTWAAPNTTPGVIIGVGERGKERGFILTNWGGGQTYFFDPVSGQSQFIANIPTGQPSLPIGGCWLGNNTFCVTGGGAEPNTLAYYSWPDILSVKQVTNINSRRGMFYDGFSIWTVSIADIDVKQLVPHTLSDVRKAWTLSGTTFAQQSVAFDGKHMWAAQNNGQLILQIV